MTPDVMHYHYDIVDPLPPGAVLLLSSHGYPNQAWRIGPAAWGLQFHIEPDAAVHAGVGRATRTGSRWAGSARRWTRRRR